MRTAIKYRTLTLIAGVLVALVVLAAFHFYGIRLFSIGEEQPVVRQVNAPLAAMDYLRGAFLILK